MAPLAIGLMACFLGCGTPPTEPQVRPVNSSQPMNPLVCRLANYGPHQDAAWNHLPSIGIRHVFMNVPPADQVEAVQTQLAQHGLTAVVLRGDADLSLPTGLDTLTGQLAVCERMNVRYLFLSVKRRDTPKEIIYQRLHQAGDLARRHGVIIALETHPDLGTNGDVHRQTMQHVNHPHVRVNFDTANIHYYNQGANAVEELRKVIEFVATVEVKDHNGQFESWHFPALGRGIVDIPGVLQLLRAHHYSGPVTIEIEGIKGQERGLDQIQKDIEDSVSYLRSLQSFD